MRLAQVPERLASLAEEHQVAERLQHAGNVAGKAATEGARYAREGARYAREGARYAYHVALDHPRTSAGAIAVAAALVGGVLWYIFRDRRRPAARRPAARVRAGTERRVRAHGRSRAA